MKIKSEILSQLENNIIKQELEVAKRNKQNETEEIEGYVDLLDSVREPKQYEWMSDIRIPEFISHILTQASIDANQYFQTRDFVDIDEIVSANLMTGFFPYTKAEIINIASGKSTTLLELIDQIAKRLQCKKPPIIFMPPRNGDIIKSEADCQRYMSLKKFCEKSL